jgi:hypothetical protein
MRKVKNCWTPMLLGAVLMATLVGVAGVRGDERPEAGALSRRITVPAGHFFPNDDAVNWQYHTHYLVSETDGTDQRFNAPVVFPTGQAVMVESITLYAYDNNASDNVCAFLLLIDPTAGDGVVMANVCSDGASENDPGSFTDSTVENNPAKHGKGVFLGLRMEDDTDLKAYGVRIQYHHGTT